MCLYIVCLEFFADVFLYMEWKRSLYNLDIFTSFNVFFQLLRIVYFEYLSYIIVHMIFVHTSHYIRTSLWFNVMICVVSDFLSVNVASGAESPRNINCEHKPPIPTGKRCHVITGASPGHRRDEDHWRWSSIVHPRW